MKTFLLRLVVTLIVLYGLGAAAYGLLHYPSGERPDVGGVLGDFSRDLGSVFRRKESANPAPAASNGPALGAEGQPVPGAGALPSLDSLRGDSHLSLGLALIQIPNLDRLPVAAVEQWAPLKPIHATVLPEAITELARLRTLAATDKPAFERDRTAVRARLATARATLVPKTQGEYPMEAAVKLLSVLDEVDSKLAGL